MRRTHQVCVCVCLPVCVSVMLPAAAALCFLSMRCYRPLCVSRRALVISLCLFAWLARAAVWGCGVRRTWCEQRVGGAAPLRERAARA
eukprot:COSAG06_NODE_860_length_11903_cov_3.097170_15_plen_88_part_00